MTTVKNVFYWTLLGLRAALFPLSKIPFVVLILLLGFYALYINDQGQDLMAAFTAKDIFNSSYLLLFEVFLVCWAISIWNVSRILLTAANLRKLVEKEIPAATLAANGILAPVQKNYWVVASIDPNYKRVLERMIKWTPRLLALCPYLIFILAFSRQYGTFSKSFPGAVISIIIAAVLHLLYMIYRKQIWQKITGSAPGGKSAYSIDGERGVSNALRKGNILINTILTIIMAFIMFGYAVWAANLTPTTEGKPGLILLTGFTVYTLIGLVFNLIINWFRVPVFLLLVAFAVFFAFRKNNNHTVQTLRSHEDSVKMLDRKNWRTDSAYAEYWLRRKIANKTIDTGKVENIFIVTAEGGGSRNCYWTYAVLNELQKRKPSFYDKTFAVTGVSGGSIGLGFYYNYRYVTDSFQPSPARIQPDEKKIDAICASDYLSRVTYGFLFPDLLQRFIPFRLDSWDRSKLLANSFDDGFSRRTDSSGQTAYLSKNYLDMWADSSSAYRYPAILFNSIFNEDGLKAIYAPFVLSDTYYTGVMDILSETNRSVPMKEAMVSSARFPILMAPGLIWRDSCYDKDPRDSVPMGHLSDGGGFENTGIQTGQQTALLLRSVIRRNGLSQKIKINILYIGTGTRDIAIDDKIPGLIQSHGKSIGSGYEIAWLNGGLKTLFGWITGSHNMVKRLSPELSVLKFGLQIKEDSAAHALPLGWYLSDSSRNRMYNQASVKLNPSLEASMKAFEKLN